MTAYGTEFFSMRDVNRLRILQDVIDRNLRLVWQPKCSVSRRAIAAVC